MKKTPFYIILACLLTFACKDNAPTIDPSAKSIDMLTASRWVTQSVEHTTDGDLTFQYENFSIIFHKNSQTDAEGDYVVVNGGHAFGDAYGTWSLGTNMITLSNGQKLNIENLTDQSLDLNLVVATPTGGRVSGVSGEFTFHLKH